MAMFPKEIWPLAFRANGHLLLNSEKMSKSTGNFLTLHQAIEEFSSDATRFALAGVGEDDANFVTETANSAILRLTKEITWMQDVLEACQDLRSGTGYSFADRVFENEINIAVALAEKSYSSMMLREALKSGLFNLQTARDEYRLLCSISGLHESLISRFMDVQTRLLAPICPHYAEHVWSEVLKKDGFAVNAGWPTPDYGLQRANKYLQDTVTGFGKVLQKQTAPPKKQKQGAAVVPVKLTVAVVFVAEEYGAGRSNVRLKILQENYDEQTQTFCSDSQILALLSKILTDDSKKKQKQCMPFIKFKKDETLAVGPQALNLKLPLGEVQVLSENSHLIERQLGLEQVEIHSYSDSTALPRAGPHLFQLQQSPPSPGNPAVVFLAAAQPQVSNGEDVVSNGTVHG